MPFHKVLEFLYQKAEANGLVKNQDDFAKRHGIKRETMNQFMTGNNIPPDKTIWQMLNVEGYRLYECIELPDITEAKAKHPELYALLDAMIALADEERVKTLYHLLQDMVEAATRGNGKRKRKPRAESKADEGNIAAHEKRRKGYRDVVGKPPRAS